MFFLSWLSFLTWQVGKMLLSRVENCVSSLAEEDFHGLTTLIFTSIGLEVASSLPQLKKLSNLSLLALQTPDLGIDVSDKVNFDFYVGEPCIHSQCCPLKRNITQVDLVSFSCWVNQNIDAVTLIARDNISAGSNVAITIIFSSICRNISLKLEDYFIILLDCQLRAFVCHPLATLMFCPEQQLKMTSLVITEGVASIQVLKYYMIILISMMTQFIHLGWWLKLCWFQVVDIIEKLREMELVRIKQEPDSLIPSLSGR